MVSVSVLVHGEEVDVVVLSVKEQVQTVVCVNTDAAQHQTFRQDAEEQVIVCVLPGSGGNGLDLAVNGTNRLLDRVIPEGLDVRHLHGRIQVALFANKVALIMWIL